jgi:hypothetical protein
LTLAEGWLESEKTSDQLMELAEEKAAEDAVSRVRRRDQV